MPGPRPVPKSVLKMRGSWRSKSKPDELIIPEGIPERPSWCTGDARKVWDKLIPTLSQMHVLAPTDGIMLARYAVLFVQWRRCLKHIEESGSTYQVGELLKQNPSVGMALALSQQLTKIETEFGLSPSSRTRLRVPERKARESEAERKKAKYFTDAS